MRIHPDCRLTGSRDGGQVSRPFTTVSARENLRPRWPGSRSTPAQWVGQTDVQLQPLVDALRETVLSQGVIHADETPVQMLAPGDKKIHHAYIWAYCITPSSALKAVVYDLSPSRVG